MLMLDPASILMLEVSRGLLLRFQTGNAGYKVLRELKKIKLAWKDLNYSTAPEVLILHPSTPAIPPASGHPELVS